MITYTNRLRKKGEGYDEGDDNVDDSNDDDNDKTDRTL